jgi:hypothetical protein
VNSLFFWIIVLSFVVPAAMRLYRRSVRSRNQDQGMPGSFGQFPGNYPGQQNTQPRDGFTQRDYYGGFGQLGAPQQPLPPSDQQFQSPVPYEDSPEYPGNRNQPGPQQSGSSVPPPPPAPSPSGPQGFRARKLAELDQQYSNGEIGMEEYMARRADIMNG